MPHQSTSSLFDVFGFGSGSALINVPAPGDSDLGGTVIDVITSLLPRLPLPRIPVPKLPLPPGPTGRGPLRLPIPIPIPLPGGLFGNGECGPANPCCSGQHLDKATGTKCVSNRRMNPLNPRALRRATRRLKGFERAVVTTRKQLRTLAKI